MSSTSALMRATVLSVLACVATFGSVASAHFALLEPSSSVAVEDGGKGAPPCGEGPASNIVTPVQGGHPLKIRLSEFVYHPGHYRIALSVHSRDELPLDPDVDAQDGISLSAAIQNPPQIPILADGVFVHSDGFGVQDWQTDIVLPNVTCEKCTLQIIEFMAEHGFNVGGGYYYHHCADLRITADPNLGPPDLGWTLNPVRSTTTSNHYIAQIASGSGLSSSIVLANPSFQTAVGSIGFSDDEGRPLKVPLQGQAPAAALSFTLKPLGSATFTTDSAAEPASGSALITSNVRLASVVKLSTGGGGTSSVGESIPMSAAVAAVVRNQVQGLNTGIAIRNVQNNPIDVTLSLRRLDGAAVPDGFGAIQLAANGHVARFIDELLPNAVTTDFTGTLLVRPTAAGAAIGLSAIEIGRSVGQFATLPIVAADAAPQGSNLYLPHIGNGSAFTSSLWLINPLGSPAAGEVRFFDDSGGPLPLNIAGRLSDRFQFSLQPQAAMVATTDGLGSLTTGWARVTADSALGGFVTFSQPSLGLAAAGAIIPAPRFITPVVRKAVEGLSTAVAIAAPDSDAALSLTLWHKNGEAVQGGHTDVSLPANGHIARFIEELFPAASTENFEGTLTITDERGNVTVTALQIGAGEFTALPVAPMQ